MVRTLLVRGMLVGLLAGVLGFVFAYLVGEPPVDAAIAIEESAAAAAGGASGDEPEVVSRLVQSTLGLLTALAVFGAALGGIFGLAFAYAQGRLGRIGPRGTAAFLAVAGFISLVLVPQIKYPANPPAVGSPDTIDIRTGLYFTLILLSVVAALAALAIGRRLVAQYGTWNAALIGGGVYVVAMALAMFVMPTINEVPAEFAPAVLWDFRVATIGLQVVLWTTLGVAFGLLSSRQTSAASRSG
ncbi:CbtA family protein [Pseudochelatococcus lubricantis]|uniref:CbtA family protein n=1 Tax=Pseudochelatococcus lubricantis TaxID=1538102 RepID=UPI0035E5DAA9